MPSRFFWRPAIDQNTADFVRKILSRFYRAIWGLALLALVLQFSASAQYRLDAFTTDNGLPQNGVRDLVQTPDGYIWFTTFDGLVRYDGVRFLVFDKNNSPGILSNRFFLLRAEADGTLLAGTEDSGVTIYKKGIFRTFTTADGLPSNRLVDFGEDVNGEFYVWTAEGKCYLREGSCAPVPDERLPNNGRFYRGPTGTVWHFDLTGIREFRDHRQINEYKIPIRVYNEKLTGLRLFEDRRGFLWFGDLTGVYRLKDGIFHKFSAVDGVPPNVSLRPYVEDDDGGIWFSSGMPWIAGVGLVHLTDGKFSIIGPSSGLSSVLIHGLVRDREDNLWVSTADRGLNRLRRQFIRSFSVGEGLVGKEVYPILQTRDDDVYVGSTLGLSVFRDGVFRTENLPTTGGPISVTALFEEDSGVLWAGSTNGTYYKRENGVWRRFLTGDNSIIWSIHKDRAGYVRMASDKGIYEVRDGVIAARFTTEQGLPSNDVKIIFQDRSGTIWLGTYNGLVKIENCDGFLRECQKETINASTGLSSDRVRTIYEDAGGTIWVGTYDGGISRIAGDRIVNFSIENGLFNNGAFQILEDAQHNFWISCNKGIYRVSRAELDDFADGKVTRINSVAYGKVDGMLNTETNGGRQPAGIRTVDGKLWFPTQDGVAIVDPLEVKTNRQVPAVQIETVLVDRIARDFASGIEFGANENNLEIRYTGISFVKPELVRFRYRLEGLTESWTDVNNIREVYFPSLPDGEYTFHVIAANSDGVWNDDGARLSIRVHAPFWRRTWFIVVAAVLGIIVIVTFFRLRERELRRRERQQQEFSRRLLESQEGERKRIASEMHDSLGQYLLAIKNWALFGLNSIPKEDKAREYLREVSETSTLALDEVREIAHNLRPYQLERLGLTNTLEYMLKNITASSAIRFEYQIDKVDDFFSKADDIVFYRIVQESVNNVIKHSAAERATVSVRLSDDVLTFRCDDDGRGFDPAVARNSAESGLGLNGVAERVKILQGVYRIDSEAARGTSVLVEVKRNAAN